MITTNVLITIVICLTIITSIIIICYYTNDESKKTKLKAINDTIMAFRDSYVIRKRIKDSYNDIYISNATSEEVMNLICTIEKLTRL